MFTTLTVLVASAVAAQAASSSNPYIPTDISSACQAYLTQMNTDNDLAQCTSALLAATKGFAPGGENTSASKATISSALTTICSTSTSKTCSSPLMSGKLASFYTACGPELTSSRNAQVVTIYDTMYTLPPFLTAVCSKDDSGNWCALQTNASSAAASLTPPAIKSSVARRDDSVTAYMPNATAIDSANVLFMFLTANLPKEQLCTTCTRNILAAYISQESSINYAPGLLQSTLMSGQPELYQGVVGTCGSDFLKGTVKAAGSLGQGTGSSGALPLRTGSVLAMLAGSLACAALLL